MVARKLTAVVWFRISVRRSNLFSEHTMDPEIACRKQTDASLLTKEWGWVRWERYQSPIAAVGMLGRGYETQEVTV